MLHINLGLFPVTWQKIGSIPKVGSTLSTNSIPFTCIVNGYWSVFYPCKFGGNPQFTRGAVLFSFDGLGGMCTYMTPDFSFAGNQSDVCAPSQIFQNGNTFFYSLLGGGIWKLTIPNIFKAGATYVVGYEQLPVPSPCNSGIYQQTISCGKQGLYANEFILAGTGIADFWASIYDTLGNFVGGGFIGSSPSDTDDIFDQRATALPPGVFQTNFYDRNGLTVYGNFGHGQPNQQVVGFGQNQLNGSPSELLCGSVRPGNSVYVNEINTWQNYYNRDFNIPGFGSSPDYVIGGITDIQGFTFFNDSVMSNILLGQDFFIQLPQRQINSPIGYFFSTKKIYSGNFRDNFGNYLTYGDIYIATLDLTQHGFSGPLPNVSPANYTGMANYHRAVSPNGTFQA